MATVRAEYRYEGFLSRVLDAPDPSDFDALDSISFGVDDLAKWRTEDLPHTTEWRGIPGRKVLTEDGLRLEGDFRGVIGIEALSPNDPRYWVPLGSLGLTDGRLPIDANRYPVIEVTYRCTSPHAHPTWMWTYEGGSHFGALPKSQEWHTVARVVQYDGFPGRIDNLIFRLYSGVRSVESFEIASVRFREMADGEREAISTTLKAIREERPSTTTPLLEDFLPLGVYMDAESAKRLAGMLNISAEEYLDFVTEDLVSHNHNAVFLAHTDRLEEDEWGALLSRCRASGIRLVPRHEFPIGGDAEEQQRILDTAVTPYKDDSGILAHSLSGEPIENDFFKVLDARKRIEEADPNHPVCLVARYPNAYPLFAPFFSVSGVGHFASRHPWDVGRMVRAHVPLSEAQQFWVAAPSFQYPTQTPDWSTCPEMRLMFNLAFANGARGWFAYSYHNDPVWLRGRVQRTLTGPFLLFSDLWEELAQRMRWADALAPLFLNARMQDSMDDWFLDAVKTESMIRPAPGVAPISNFHLAGDDYSMYFTVSNNLRDIASVNIELPRHIGQGRQVIDLTGFLATHVWETMPRQRHVEMFPGHAHVMLVASQQRCNEWRDVITRRLINNDLRKLPYELRQAKANELRTADVERAIGRIVDGHSEKDYGVVHTARERLRNRLFSCTDYAETNSLLISASASICGCDGALCHLMSQGNTEKAVFLGREVVPLAAELTHLRLELKAGNGKAVRDAAEDLTTRARDLLQRIRSDYEEAGAQQIPKPLR